MSNTDMQLLENWWQQGDAEAFRKITSLYAGMVYATCTRILGNADEAEDVTQECFELLAHGEKRPSKNLAPWLHRVAANRLLMRLRSDKRRVHREKQFAEQLGEKCEVQWDDVYEYVDESISELPDKLHAPLVEHFINGLTHKEIAEMLDISRRTVSHRISIGIEDIRDSLKKRGITVALPSLSILLLTNLAKAATISSSLSARLGKLAIVGRSSVTVAKVVGGAGLLSSLKFTALPVFVLTVFTAIGVTFLLKDSGSKTTVEQVIQLRNSQKATVRTTQSQTNMRSLDGEENVEEPEISPSFPGKSNGVIRGRVVESDGSWVVGAKVNLELVDWEDHEYPKENTFHRSTTSDENGLFEFSGLPVKSFDTTKKLITTYRYGLSAFTDNTLAVAMKGLYESQPVQEVLLRLRPAGTLSGVVLDPSGRPVRGAVLYPDKSEVEDKEVTRWTVNAIRKVTDANGEFSFAHLWLGRFRFSIRTKEYPVFVSQFVETGSENIEFHLEKGGSLSGRIVDADSGHGVPEISLWMWSERGRRRWKSDSSGNFDISPIASGKHSIAISDPLLVQMEKLESFYIENGQSHTDVEILVTVGGVVTGRVYDEKTGNGITDIWVDAEPVDHNGFAAGREAWTDESGNYRLKGLHAVKYGVKLQNVASGYRTLEVLEEERKSERQPY